MNKKELKFLHITGILDGISLLLLLSIAMPLKYFADLPIAVQITGSIHGAIFVTYLLSILIVQLRIRWAFKYSFMAGVVAFIPFGNFVFDRFIKKYDAKLA
ncbi:DUF3817 domain-containing protein [Kurthia sibirica]|uniref:DUF3817 domain-containing protein n=1 Tax=Kurthia sibirica TaxID=202750 RepID=A0A2U3AJN5_9BACL|nr:DUF3817 domain-containing protein [Kurthia sibirica]PWI24737.1 hypothetical protein DEX24_12310 [Kurthia sibirica]GEK34767.1 putative membrane protein YdzA [Kurthia sibirica]